MLSLRLLIFRLTLNLHISSMEDKCPEGYESNSYINLPMGNWNYEFFRTSIYYDDTGN